MDVGLTPVSRTQTHTAFPEDMDTLLRNNEAATRSWPEFIVLDLFSQGRAVQQHVQGWSKDEVLTWLRRWGTLSSWQLRDFPETHSFRSHCGMVANFIFEDGLFTFLGDHHLVDPPE